MNEKQKEIARKIIYAVETGGRYTAKSGMTVTSVRIPTAQKKQLVR